MPDGDKPRRHDLWARMRFSIIGSLLSSPPGRSELREEIARLAAREWIHPVTGREVQFGFSTIERWYYVARAATADPVTALRRRLRQDSGQHPTMTEQVRRALQQQHAEHPGWSYKLHADNLRSLVRQQTLPEAVPSYTTVRRYMKSHGLLRQKRPRPVHTMGAALAQHRLATLEVRSYECEYVNGLWHLDFHQGSRKVITAPGEWVTPHLLGILDDHSRLGCHAQWYLAENAENLAHGLNQAFLKRDLPRSLMSDRGGAMMAEETREGLARLSVLHEPTLPYSAYQNGKQEAFWGQVEGRLLAMLENFPNLTLALLNEATQAWIEMEYNRTDHSGTGQPPLERFLNGRSVGRACPPMEDLRLAFCQQTSRKQRTSDGTITLEGIRFEVPNRYRHLPRITVRYAGWDLTRVHMVDERTNAVLTRLYPLDKARNADGRRRTLDPIEAGGVAAPPAPGGIAPLLRELMEEYASTGLPPAYLPKEES